MNCSAWTEDYVSGPRIEAACRLATDEHTRNRQAAVLYLRSADTAHDAVERDDLRRQAALLVLPRRD